MKVWYPFKGANPFQDRNVRRVTKYVSPTETIKITRQLRVDSRDQSATFLVTVGRPNFRERDFIKAARKAGEPFPIKKPQLTFWPKKKPAKRRRK